MKNQPKSVAIGLATYHRPDLVRGLMPALLTAIEEAEKTLGWALEVSVLVVDNDPERSGRDAVLETGDPRIHYFVEPRPGVASVRNRILSEAAGHDVLIFIDDDELPQSGWLEALLKTFVECAADAVTGPVHSVFDGPLDPWVEASDAYLRTHRSKVRTGDEVRRAATNNLLLDLDRVHQFGITFDERFGLTGGEDSYFTGQLHQKGARIVWCAEAVVDDLVPQSRANRAYNLRRRYSLSNASTRVELLLAPVGPARVLQWLTSFAHGVGKILKGVVQTLRGRLLGTLRDQAYGERHVVSGLAVLAACFGIYVSPYSRKSEVN